MVSLMIVAPLGILAGIYLNEYAPDNWLTRAIGMAVTSLAGVPSIVHALFAVGAFVYTLGMGKSLLAAACTIAVMTIPVIVTATREALGCRADGLPRGLLEHGRHQVADHPHHRLAELSLRDPDRGDPGGRPAQQARPRRSSSPVPPRLAVSTHTLDANSCRMTWTSRSWHSRTTSTSSLRKSPACREDEVWIAAVLIGLILTVNSVAIALRVWLRSRKKW